MEKEAKIGHIVSLKRCDICVFEDEEEGKSRDYASQNWLCQECESQEVIYLFEQENNSLET